MYTAAYLTPIIVVLGLAGLLLPYRMLCALAQRVRNRVTRLSVACVIGAAVVAGAFALSAGRHRDAWLAHGEGIRGRTTCRSTWAGGWPRNLPSDASIASRERRRHRLLLGEAYGGPGRERSHRKEPAISGGRGRWTPICSPSCRKRVRLTWPSARQRSPTWRDAPTSSSPR